MAGGSGRTPAPGVRARLRISFSSAQRLARASESPATAVLAGGGCETVLRAGLISLRAPLYDSRGASVLRAEGNAGRPAGLLL